MRRPLASLCGVKAGGATGGGRVRAVPTPPARLENRELARDAVMFATFGRSRFHGSGSAGAVSPALAGGAGVRARRARGAAGALAPELGANRFAAQRNLRFVRDRRTISRETADSLGNRLPRIATRSAT